MINQLFSKNKNPIIYRWNWNVQLVPLERTLKVLSKLCKNILIFDNCLQEKVKNYSLFSVIFAKFPTFYPKTPKCPTAKVLTWIILKHF